MITKLEDKIERVKMKTESIEEAANKYVIEFPNAYSDTRECIIGSEAFVAGAKSEAAKEYWRKILTKEDKNNNLKGWQ